MVAYPMTGVFREVVVLVFTNLALDADGNILLDGLTSVTFTELDGKTTLTLQTRARGFGPQVAGMLDGMHEGWAQSLDSLAEHLGAMAFVTQQSRGG